MDPIDTGSNGLAEWRSVALQEVIDNFDVVSVKTGNHELGTSPYIVVSERDSVKLARQVITGPNLQEFGYTSMSPWTAWTREERVPELRDKLGVRKWYDMKRNDGTVRGSLNVLKTPIRAARWYIEPASDSTVDKNIADFISSCFFDKLNVGWSQVLDDILLMFEYGYMPFEKVFKFDKDGRIVLKKIAPRHPLDIREWIFDDQGGPAGIIMEPFVPYGNLGDNTIPAGLGNVYDLGAFIPVRKLAIFTLESEAGDLRGISILRTAYKHWYYKDTLYKIDAIQKERHGIGIPVIKLPPGFSDADKNLAENLGRNLRTNDRAHIVIPANWEILFAKLEGQPVSCIESIDHHNAQIQVNVLAPFMNDPAPDQVSMDMFFKSTRYLADSVGNIFNKFIIPELVDFNFSRGSYPKLRARRIGEWEDLRTWSFAFRNLVGAGSIIPDDPLERFLRNELDLPAPDPTTARKVDTPQGAPDTNEPKTPKAPKAGPPRQNQSPPVKTPAANAGRDSSGG